MIGLLRKLSDEKGARLYYFVHGVTTSLRKVNNTIQINREKKNTSKSVVTILVALRPLFSFAKSVGETGSHLILQV